MSRRLLDLGCATPPRSRCAAITSPLDSPGHFSKIPQRKTPPRLKGRGPAPVLCSVGGALKEGWPAETTRLAALLFRGYARRALTAQLAFNFLAARTSSVRSRRPISLHETRTRLTVASRTSRSSHRTLN